ncbi:MULTISPECIES: PilZ domain-containing protein [Desulfococcus]|jgi:hypothetical protein|uniref:Type IV pilus assembly PilZ n=1 Tax=Desulfococcus multivorans DSM 2059 TaxID=1121405 RepID=S7UPF5_DESML|nr:PilZ domain-containing protein [Desulfococcus multivorans]AOY59890.1 putative pilus assembly protein PilZ, type IV [Desulfococcus multivorans]AQV02046.1 hypothetical protein B2D07_15615 [Desulfococcus multivorans]EPR35889.1 type IV pilus assembly PilZ [Desulfococcus multivorans DSM 2059]MDX9818132.1 PilZ domain-containing protein [Desulfococcus multivorans]SJZ34650.1 PilZ domain-containing protein [Desulfococcus multivorans DSM 2059]
MNEVKAFIDNSGEAVIKCPRCHATRVVDVKEYSRLDHIVRFKVTCPCKHVYRVILERREFFRKPVRLTGVCRMREGVPAVDIHIHNLSRKGLRIELMKDDPPAIGDKVTVEFRLDDEKKTLIRKEALVRTLMGRFVGLEFFSIDPYNVYDKALGFYLM